jgi:excisionase family DNA binding protein
MFKNYHTKALLSTKQLNFTGLNGIICFRGCYVLSLLTVEEVAQRLKIKAVIVRRWLRDGRLVGLRLGRLWRVGESALEEFIEKAKNKNN